MNKYIFLFLALFFCCSCGFFQRTELVNNSEQSITVDLYLSTFKNSQFGIRTDSVCLDDSIKIEFQHVGAHDVIGHLKNSIQTKKIDPSDCLTIKQNIKTSSQKNVLGTPLTIIEMDAAKEWVIIRADLQYKDRLLLGHERVKKKKDISFDWDQLIIHQGATNTIISSIGELNKQVDSIQFHRGCADCAATITSLISID